MLSDILKSAQTNVIDRLTSPLAGSIALAWAGWNYKFLVILFSNNTVTKTFALVDTIVYPTQWAFWSRAVLYPVLSAAAYIYIYPYPAKYVYAFTRRRQKELNDQQRIISEDALMTVSEARSLRADLAKREVEYLAEIDRLNKHNQLNVLHSTDLGDISEAAETQSPPPPASNDQSNPKEHVSTSQLKVLMTIAELGQRTSQEEVFNAYGDTRVKFDYDVQALADRRLISRDYLALGTSTKRWRLSLLQPGREIVINNS